MFCLNYHLFVVLEELDVLVGFIDVSILILKCTSELFYLTFQFSDGFVQFRYLVFNILVLFL